MTDTMGVLEELSTKVDALQGMVQQLLDMQQQQQAPIVPDLMLDLDQAAEYMGYNRKYFYTVKENIPHFKCGNRLKFRKSDLDDFMTKTRFLSRYQRDAKAASHVAMNPISPRILNTNN